MSVNQSVRRCSALAANAAFIAYGLAGGLWPVLALHFVLVPINVAADANPATAVAARELIYQAG